MIHNVDLFYNLKFKLIHHDNDNEFCQKRVNASKCSITFQQTLPPSGSVGCYNWAHPHIGKKNFKENLLSMSIYEDLKLPSCSCVLCGFSAAASSVTHSSNCEWIIEKKSNTLLRIVYFYDKHIWNKIECTFFALAPILTFNKTDMCTWT